MLKYNLYKNVEEQLSHHTGDGNPPSSVAKLSWLRQHLFLAIALGRPRQYGGRAAVLQARSSDLRASESFCLLLILRIDS